MTNSVKLKKGLKVQIELDVGTLPNSKTVLDCFILEAEFDRLTLSFPEEYSEYIPYLTEGTEIRAYVYSFEGIQIVDSIVYDEPSKGQTVIEYNEEHRTIQRRKYERVPYSVDMYVQDEAGNIKLSTVDVSGGGARFVSKVPFRYLQKISVMLRLIAHEPMLKAEGVVLKKDYFGDNEYVIEFTNIDEEDRKKIVNKCEELKRQSKNW